MDGFRIYSNARGASAVFPGLATKSHTTKRTPAETGGRGQTEVPASTPMGAAPNGSPLCRQRESPRKGKGPGTGLEKPRHESGVFLWVGTIPNKSEIGVFLTDLNL